MGGTDHDGEVSVRAARLLAGGLALLVLLELALVWAHPWLPSNDGPAHQYSAWVAHRLRDDPGSPLAEYFQLNPALVYPNALYPWFLEALAGRVPMPVAEKLGVSLYLVALPLAMLAFCRALRREPWLPAYLAAGLSFNLPLFLGFFSFLWGLPLVLLALACVERTIEEPRPGRALATNLLVVLAFCTHLVAFAMAVCGALVLVASAWPRRPWRALVAFLPASALAPFFWPSTVALDAPWVWHARPWQRALEGATLQVASAFGDAERLAAVGIGIPLAAAAVYGLVRPGAGRRSLSALAASAFVAVLAVPTRLGAGGRLDQRAMLFFWLILAAAVVPAGRRSRSLGAAAISAAIVAHLVFLDARFRDFDAEMSVYLSAAPRIEKGAQVCYFTGLDRHHPWTAQPMVTAHAYYSMALESPDFDHYQAAPRDAPHFPVGYTAAGRTRYAQANRSSWLPVGRIAEWAEYVLIWGEPGGQVDRFERAARYRLSYRNDPLRLLARRPAGARGARRGAVPAAR